MTIQINELIYITCDKVPLRKGRNKREFPFFSEKIILSELTIEDDIIKKIIDSKSLDVINITNKLYFLRVECIEMTMEIVGLNVIVHDPSIDLRLWGNDSSRKGYNFVGETHKTEP